MSLKNIDSQEFVALLDYRDAIELIDVRNQEEFDMIKVIGSRLIPMNEIFFRLYEIDWNKKVIMICRTGTRSEHIARILSEEKDIINLAGGIIALYKDSCDCLQISSDFSKDYLS